MSVTFMQSRLNKVRTGRRLGLEWSPSVLAILRGLDVGDFLVDLCPHVLQRLRGTTGHVDPGPVHRLAVAAKLGDDSKQELELE